MHEDVAVIGRREETQRSLRIQRSPTTAALACLSVPGETRVLFPPLLQVPQLPSWQHDRVSIHWEATQTESKSDAALLRPQESETRFALRSREWVGVTTLANTIFFFMSCSFLCFSGALAWHLQSLPVLWRVVANVFHAFSSPLASQWLQETKHAA